MEAFLVSGEVKVDKYANEASLNLYHHALAILNWFDKDGFRVMKKRPPQKNLGRAFN